MRNIAYLLDVFPVISETFILNEICQLKKKGIDLTIFSINMQNHYNYNKIIHEEAKEIMDEIIYLNNIKKRYSQLNRLSNHIILFFKSPILYLKILLKIYTKEKERLHIFKLMPYIVQIMEERKIKHIHAHFAADACKLAMLVSRIQKITFSFSAHAYDIYMKENQKEIKCYIDKSKFIITCTDYNRKYLIKNYGKKYSKKIYLNYHGVCINKYKPAEKSLNKKTNLLTIGRLVEKKGYKYLLEAMDILTKKERKNFKLYIIGDGEKKDEILKKISEYGLDKNIIMKGAMRMEELNDYYNKADLFILPCIVTKNGDRDGIPNVILEAMASGIPVITTNTSGIPEVIENGIDGILIDQKDAESLAKAIKMLGKNINLRREIGCKARIKMEMKFEKEEKINELIEIFKKLVL